MRVRWGRDTTDTHTEEGKDADADAEDSELNPKECARERFRDQQVHGHLLL